jgi:hypothetical protein
MEREDEFRDARDARHMAPCRRERQRGEVCHLAAPSPAFDQAFFLGTHDEKKKKKKKKAPKSARPFPSSTLGREGARRHAPRMGRKRCRHGKRKDSCADCNPCPHGMLKNHCADCNPCPHGKLIT